MNDWPDETQMRRYGATPSRGEAMIADGFGSEWHPCGHPDCDLHVVRPGYARCGGACERRCGIPYRYGGLTVTCTLSEAHDGTHRGEVRWVPSVVVR